MSSVFNALAPKTVLGGILGLGKKDGGNDKKEVAPTPDDALVKRAKMRAAIAQNLRSGRSSTILGDFSGTGDNDLLGP